MTGKKFTGCKYCAIDEDGDSWSRSIVAEFGEIAGLPIVISVDIYENGKAAPSIRIGHNFIDVSGYPWTFKYCPMCGRKLN